jgi:hypothetical protein
MSLIIWGLFSFVFSYLTALPEGQKTALCFLIVDGFVRRISSFDV